MLDSVTFSGLNEWYKSIFEKFGWMTLYKGEAEHKSTYEMKVNNYKRGINHWLDKATKKMAEQELSADKRKDIEIMKTKMEKLLRNVNEMLPTENKPTNMQGGMNDEDSFIINFKDDIMN